MVKQKVNKKMDAMMPRCHDAKDEGLNLCPLPWDDAAVQVPAKHLNSVQYSNQIPQKPLNIFIRCVFQILRI